MSAAADGTSARAPLQRKQPPPRRGGGCGIGSKETSLRRLERSRLLRRSRLRGARGRSILKLSRRRRGVLGAGARSGTDRMPISHRAAVRLEAATPFTGGPAGRGATGRGAASASTGIHSTAPAAGAPLVPSAVAMAGGCAMGSATTAAAMPRGGFIRTEQGDHQGGGQHRGGSHHVCHSRVANEMRSVDARRQALRHRGLRPQTRPAREKMPFHPAQNDNPSEPIQSHLNREARRASRHGSFRDNLRGRAT